ncbi:MAG: nitric oxide reductase activation protein [Bilifractor sp.]|nr:nitric oxide reductase activation protein [Lachnospiraceae bacterium]MDY2837279.1 nitric oxide reductase activation protein [Bilifractor sp.]
MKISKDAWESYPYELENRIRNLIWTVSGDYTLAVKPDLEEYSRSPEIALYNGIKQGALAKFFDQDALAMYLLKKIYCHADQKALMDTARLCIEEAVGWRLDREREGVRSLRKKALETWLHQDFGKMSAYPLGRLMAASWREKLDGSYHGPEQIMRQLERIHSLRQAETSEEIIRVIDRLYNDVVDPAFRMTLEEVLQVTPEELTEFSWSDYLKEELEDDSVRYVLERVTEEMIRSDDPAGDGKPDESASAESGDKVRKLLLIDDSVLEKSREYVQRNFGKSYLTPSEEKRITSRMCRGIHSDCGLFFTDGILKNPVIRNNQYVLAKGNKEKTLEYFRTNYRTIRHNVRVLTDMLKRAFALRDEEDNILSDCGQIDPSALWKVGRSEDARLFRRTLRNDSMDFVVDFLIDASGSQRKRQREVAMQAYIICEAMSNLGIPMRVMSFCTFWDYTVLRRFREYGDDRSANENIFEFTTSSNNRDGLAIRTVGQGLLEREETNKVLLVLSDGKPYDVMINRPNARNPEPYSGHRAALDAGTEVRRLRQNHVAVLGVFVGEESELAAERKIFGKDFAYIRSIDHFSNTVGRYLLRQIEN